MTDTITLPRRLIGPDGKYIEDTVALPVTPKPAPYDPPYVPRREENNPDD